MDSVGIRILGLRSSSLHSRQTNDLIFRVVVNTYIPIFRDLDARDGRKLRTDTHTHIHETTTVTLAACMPAEG